MTLGFRNIFPLPGIPNTQTIVLAVRQWGPVLANQRVLFLSDNAAMVAVINRQTTRDPQVMCLVRQLVVACLSFNICFRAKHYLSVSPNTIIIVVQHLKEEGKAPSTIRTCLSAIAESHKACRYPDPTADYLAIKIVKGVARSRPHVDQRQPISSRDLSLIIIRSFV